MKERLKSIPAKVWIIISGSIVSCCLCLGILAVNLPDNAGEPEIASRATSVVIEDADLERETGSEESELPTATKNTPASEPLPLVTEPAPSATAVPAKDAVETAVVISPSVPDGELATVIEIVDGDTIRVSIDGDNYSVRYIGMDTPERGALLFAESTEANRQLVAGQQVILVKDVSERDRYNRLLRYVTLLDGTFVNAELVRLGFAQTATYPPDVAFQELFAELQVEARKAQVGLWAETAVSGLLSSATPAPLPTDTAMLLPTNTSVPLPTASPLPQPTNPPLPSGTPPPVPTEPLVAPGQVVISSINYDGQVAEVESDEYAVITNIGGSSVNLSGWRLNADDNGQDFWFPSFEIQPGQSCRVYTNEIHPETCGFSFNYGRALWANKGECGHLFNPEGIEESYWCYG